MTRLIKALLGLFFLLVSDSVYALPDYNRIFADVDPCFIFYDLNNEEIVEKVGGNKCHERVSPCSTFKVALSLIGFDSGILKSEENPEWKFEPKYQVALDTHAKNHTPKSWMANSVVWYSQELTKKLGMKKFKYYIDKLNYGNKDLSGNPGQNNGLTHSWLGGSSLKISANEQIEFLKKLINHKLPISQEAIKLTKNITFLEELTGGWKLYGKTGSGLLRNPDGSKKEDLWLGWFIGFLEKQEQIYIFAVNIHDKHETKEFGGPRAKKIAKEIFAELDYLK